MTDAGTVLVTGAAGFIGAHAARAYLRRGHPVIAVDCLDDFYEPALKRANLDALAADAPAGRFEFVHRDIRDQPAMHALYERARPVLTVHLAARAGVRPSIAAPALYSAVNVEGTAVLLDAARRAVPASPFLFASSSSVYGNNAKVPFSEDDPVDAPISPYAATKRAGELIARTFHELYGLPIACLRFFTVYGPRQRPDLAIARFLDSIAAGRPVTMFGDGSMERDFTFIDDILTGIDAAAQRIPAFGFRTWNLGSDRPVRVDALIDAVARVVGRPAIIERRPVPPGDVVRTCADLTRSRAELGYHPTTSLDAGLRLQADSGPAVASAR